MIFMRYNYEYKAECQDGATGMMSLPDKSIKLIYGSPPYPNAERDYGSWPSADYIDKMAPFFDAAERKLSDDGFLVINVKANREKPAKGCCTKRSLVIERMAILLEERWHFHCVDIEIWVKENPVPTGLRSACQDAYEQNLWFSKSPKWTINLDAIRRPYDESSLKAYENNEYKPRTNGLSYVRKVKKITPNPKGALPLNVIKGAVSSRQSMHQAVQPEYLPERYIKATTKEGDLVVDPWLGTGTTGMAALRLKRRFVGFDIFPQFADYANAAFAELVNSLNMKSKVTGERKKLQDRLIRDLGNAVESFSSTEYRPLNITLNKPAPLSLTIYLFPNTNPPGGRSHDEYKFNLNVPGQERGQRGNFDSSDGIPVLMSYTEDYDVYVIYNAEMHKNFSNNANVQSKQQLLTKALTEKVATYKKDSGEVLIGVTSKHLIDGIRYWLREYTAE